MLLKSLSIAAAGLAVASAFLLPPDVTAVEIPELMNPFEQASQNIDVPCPGCPMRGGDSAKLQWTKNTANHLQLHFSVANNRLRVNEFELYPKVNPQRVLFATQAADAQEDRKDVHLRKHPKAGYMRKEPLGYSLRVHPEGMDKATGFGVISIDLQIIEVGSAFVSGVPNVHIKLIKAPDGSLIIGSLETTPSRSHTASYKSKLEKCTNFLCKWRVIVAAHMEQLKPHACAMKGKFGHKGHKGHGGHEHPGAHHHHPHPHHPHHPHNGKQSAWEGHTWHKLVKQLVKSVLYPIVAGMIVGIAVCVVGMSVGTIIVACWRIFVRHQTPAAAFGTSPFHRRCRRHRRSSRAQKAVDAEVAISEEKASLIETEEAPPSYKDEDSPKTEA